MATRKRSPRPEARPPARIPCPRRRGVAPEPAPPPPPGYELPDPPPIGLPAPGQDPAVAAAALLEHIAVQVNGRYLTWRGLYGPVPAYLWQLPKPVVGWDGRVDPADVAKRWTFLQVTRRCLRRRIDPLALVHDAFGADHAAAPPPPPEAFLEPPPALLRRLARRTSEAADLNFSLGMDHFALHLRLQGRLSPTLDNAGVLRAALEHSSFEPLAVARFALAWLCRSEGWAWRYWDRAVVQYSCAADAYNASHGMLIPDPLWQAVAALHHLVDHGTD